MSFYTRSFIYQCNSNVYSSEGCEFEKEQEEGFEYGRSIRKEKMKGIM